MVGCAVWKWTGMTAAPALKEKQENSDPILTFPTRTLQLSLYHFPRLTLSLSHTPSVISPFALNIANQKKANEEEFNFFLDPPNKIV